MQRISRRERAEIAEVQQIERKWWGESPRFQDENDVRAGIANGSLVPVHESRSLRISAKVPMLYRVLTPEASKLLYWVAEEWMRRMRQTGDTEHFLVVTSLTRPLTYQRELRRQGYAALSKSSHECGVAFDIGVAWFREHLPFAAKALLDVAHQGKREGKLNIIDEPTIGVFHFAMSPELLTERI